VSEFERLQRDIDILRETLRIDQSDLAAVSLKSAEVRRIREHICWCIDELTGLIDDRERLTIRDDGIYWFRFSGDGLEDHFGYGTLEEANEYAQHLGPQYLARPLDGFSIVGALAVVRDSGGA
jgi:hypothetical protein